VKVRFSHDLVDHGVFDLEAVPRGGEVVLLPDVPAQLRVWNVAWRLDWAEPEACVFLMTEKEYRAEADPDWKGRSLPEP
jgi:hypothetical protein